MQRALEALRRKSAFILLNVCLVLSAVIGYGFERYSYATQELAQLRAQEAAAARASLDVTKRMRERLEMTTTALLDEQTRNTQFAAQIHGIQGAVNHIQKTNAVDEELLQKYSKVYFLNENYVPMKLAPIDEAYLLRKNAVLVFHSDALPFLVRMFEAGKGAGHQLKVVSSYRSFGDQAALKNGYKMTYGSGANTFSADQGYSEHQLATTVDLTTDALGEGFTNFEKSSAYAWMLEHAWEYGFVLSYPKGNAYYVFEPWHWRFVGTALAKKLKDEGKHFYDMDQRQIDEYRAVMFD